jgi:putative membrane protein
MRQKNLVLCAVATAALLFAFTGTAGAQYGADTANSVDQQFVAQAIAGGEREIDQARAELSSTNDASVKLFAQHMIDDHTSANGQIEAIAKSVGISYPAPAKPKAAAPMPPRDYMQQTVQDHQKTIALFQDEAKNGGSDQLRTAAAQLLPTLRMHLSMAQQYTNTGRITPPQ